MSSQLILVALILNVIGAVLLVWRALRTNGASDARGRSRPRRLPLRTMGVALIASGFALLLVGQLEVTLAFWYLCVWTHVRRSRTSDDELVEQAEPRALPLRTLELTRQGNTLCAVTNPSPRVAQIRGAYAAEDPEVRIYQHGKACNSR